MKRLFAALCLISLFLLAPLLATGCRSLPAAVVGEPVSLAATQALTGPVIDSARRFATLAADKAIGGLAVGRREAFLADARRRKLDATSLGRALAVAQTASPGTAVVTTAVRPALADGRQAWLIVQVWGHAGAKTDKVRVWLIDRHTGDVITTASRQL